MDLANGKRKRYRSELLFDELFRLIPGKVWPHGYPAGRRKPGADNSRVSYFRLGALTASSTGRSSVPKKPAGARTPRRVRRWVRPVLLLVLVAPVWACAEDRPPDSPDELWSRIPSYEVNAIRAGAGGAAEPKFCRAVLEDLQHNLDRFERIPPKLQTATFDDPQLHQMLPGCSRKELTFAKVKDPNRGGAVTEGLYYEENFALWPMSMIDPDYPSNMVFVWRGPKYTFDNDKNEYLTPEERQTLEKNYDMNGSIEGTKISTCDLVPKYSFNSISYYRSENSKIRNLFFVEYKKERFLFEVSLQKNSDPYIRLAYLNKNGNPIVDSKKYCFFNRK